MATLENGFQIENLLYACSIFHHFLGSLRFVNQFRSTKTQRLVSDTPFDIVEAAIHFMNENIGKRLTLQDIADYIGYSPTRFSAVFSNKTGISPMAYLNDLKIKFACKLLDLSDLKINQICHKVGITDPYYFSRMFSKTLGMSPTEYRSRKTLSPSGE